jgi:hypothetical protein
MQSASQLPYPGSRTLAQWWRQLQPFQPSAYWVCYVYVHRIEATVRMAQNRRIEPLARLLLQALRLEPAASPCCGQGECLHHLQQRLQLPAAVLHRILLSLEQDALIEAKSQGSWTTTERGLRALELQEYPIVGHQRWVFPFVERVNDRGRRLLPPHYLPLAECPCSPWQVEAGETFEPVLLPESLSQPLSWKQEFGFPSGVEQVEVAASPLWRQVIVDRPEKALLMLVLPRGERELLGFSVRVENWTLLDEPALRLSLPPAQALWPVLRESPETGALREAWVGWCRQRSLPVGEAEACELTYQPGHLDVQAPERLLQRLRSARSDVFKGESWLLLGEGHLRPAVVLRVHARSRADAESHG